MTDIKNILNILFIFPLIILIYIVDFLLKYTIYNIEKDKERIKQCEALPESCAKDFLINGGII